MSDAYRPPSTRVLDKARAGIEAVQAALRAAGRESWYVYALRSWEVRPRAHLLYAITRHTSVPLTRSLAHALEGGATWVSGTLESQILSVDLCASGDPAEPITALEIVLVVWPWGDRSHGADGISTVAILVDATDAQGVHLTLAMERRPDGWPP